MTHARSWQKMTIFAAINLLYMAEIKKLNRIKVVLAEKDLTNKWLGQQLGKSEFTISRWATNKQQPSIEQLFDIANLLGVSVNDLLQPKEIALSSQLE